VEGGYSKGGSLTVEFGWWTEAGGRTERVRARRVEK
jgi:hypothetical protein